MRALVHVKPEGLASGTHVEGDGRAQPRVERHVSHCVGAVGTVHGKLAAVTVHRAQKGGRETLHCRCKLTKETLRYEVAP